jgi:small-conductance mechanosensitive channel
MRASACKSVTAGSQVARGDHVSLFDVHLLGVDATTLHKLLLSVAALVIVLAIRYGIVGIAHLLNRGHKNERFVFWTRQAVSLTTAVLLTLAILSIWFSSSQRLGTFAGLIGAGLAFALQKVVTAFAGYLVILRGKTFTVGDRITMGGVRGDVISLGFLQTRIMEMGEPANVQSDSNPSWVRARQYTGRVVSVTNDKVFEEPIYNYTREFPFIWEELRIPIPYRSDRRLAERILLECADAVTRDLMAVSEDVKQQMQEKYFIDLNTLKPRVFQTLTDNWIELNLRFLSRPHGARDIKDEISRMILDRFDQAGIGIASGTYAVVEFPPIKLEGDVAQRIAATLDRPVVRAQRDERRTA